MKYNFDEVIDRTNTNSIKYETSHWEEPELPENSIPLWIADMDFACPPQIIQAMHERLDRRILGYSDIVDPGYIDAVAGWMDRRFKWKINRNDLFISAGVVPAISNLVQILTKPGDKILILTPSYQPFYKSIVHNDRVPVYSKLIRKNGQYEMDIQDMEKKIVEEHVGLFIFCSPHNPSGRVWEEEELRQVAELCIRHDVKMICDEIHQDIRRKGITHIPMAKLYPDASWLFTCTAPSKTFNLAGNHLSNIFIHDKKVQEIWDEIYFYLPNPLSIAATKAAYNEAEDWVDELNEYLDENFRFMKEFIDTRIPKIRFEIPQGTYLAWLDMEGTGLTEEEIKNRFIRQAGLHIEAGDMFVDNAKFCIRVNVACRKKTLEVALKRMEEAFTN